MCIMFMSCVDCSVSSSLFSSSSSSGDEHARPCLRQELSFRICKEGSERFSDSCRRAKKPPPELFARTTELIHQGRTEELLEHDQLRSACARGEAFIGFLEPDITFRPTFKVTRQVGVEYNDQRVPAYCDRVLWKSSPYLAVKCANFWSAEDVSSSDHKPVAAKLLLHHRPLRPCWWPQIANKHTAAECRRHPPKPAASNILAQLRTWKIQLVSLSGSNLKRGDYIGKSDPFVCFQGDALVESKSTDIVPQTLNPQWPSSRLPCLQIAAVRIQDLRYERIMVSALDFDVFDAADDLGCSVLYLQAYMTPEDELQTGVLHFQLPLLSHGLAAGSIQGSFTIEEGTPVATGRFSKEKNKPFLPAPPSWCRSATSRLRSNFWATGP